MEYIKTSCILCPDTENNREILVAELGNLGFESFTETDEIVEAYIPSGSFSEEAIINLFPDDFSLFKFSYSYETIADQNWNEVWEKNYFQPLMITDECLIKAPFHTDYPVARYEIIIEPGMAFGTGNHETTSLMISEILNEQLIGKTVLDMGCGTGILSILASKRGAEQITGIDIDNWAINSTIENTVHNNISNLSVIQGGAEVIPDLKFDFIYANIQRNIILRDINQYSRVLNIGGELVVSGFYKDDLQLVIERASESGLILCRYQEKENWVAGVFTWK
jgi:ribosomal protein L11 methyltransferase